MAGYSGTPLVKKLGIKPHAELVLIDPPADFDATLGELPEGVTVRSDDAENRPFDVGVVFANERAPLLDRIAILADLLAPDGGLWIAWPKKASGVPSELGDTEVRAIGLATGLVDNKVCAIDDVWSGLRFVRRLKDRPKSNRRSRPSREK